MRRSLASIALISMLTGWLGAAPVSPLGQIGYEQENATQAVSRKTVQAELFAVSAFSTDTSTSVSLGE